MEPDQTNSVLRFGHSWRAEIHDESCDVSNFEADPGRSQRASSDSRYVLANGTRMGCLDRIGRYHFFHKAKTRNRISNSSRSPVPGRGREDPLQFADLDCSFDVRNNLPT